MSLAGAFTRSRPLMKVKKDTLFLTKWWAKQRPSEGEILRHIAPNEQQIIMPWIATFPKKVVQRATTWAWPIGFGTATYASIATSYYYGEHEEFHHRF